MSKLGSYKSYCVIDEKYNIPLSSLQGLLDKLPATINPLSCEISRF